MPIARFIIICTVLLCISTMVSAQQIPEKSLQQLQEVFGMVRDNLWKINDRFWHHGEYERCIEMMRLITQIDPHDIEAYDGGAWLMQNQFRDDEAEAFLREGLDNNPDRYDLYLALGLYLYMHERHDEAIPLLEGAVTFDVPFFAWHQLAHAYELAGQPGQALNIWLMRWYAEPEYVVPINQAERIMQGEPGPNIPANIQRSRRERKEQEFAE